MSKKLNMTAVFHFMNVRIIIPAEIDCQICTIYGEVMSDLTMCDSLMKDNRTDDLL